MFLRCTHTRLDWKPTQFWGHRTMTFSQLLGYAYQVNWFTAEIIIFVSAVNRNVYSNDIHLIRSNTYYIVCMQVCTHVPMRAHQWDWIQNINTYFRLLESNSFALFISLEIRVWRFVFNEILSFLNFYFAASTMYLNLFSSLRIYRRTISHQCL